MSSDTTSISNLPVHDLSNNMPLNNTQNSNTLNNNNMQNVNMVIQENNISRQLNTNNERRLNSDDISNRIRNINNPLDMQGQQPQQYQPQQQSQPQYTQPPQPQPQQSQYTQPQPNMLQQNEISPLLQSINQLNSNPNSYTKIPINTLIPENNNIDPLTQINNINSEYQLRDNSITQRLKEQEYLMNQNNNGNLQNRNSFYKRLFDELKIPLLICCLFFIFQMPFYKQNLYKHFHFIFQSDGNMNIYGYLSSSVLFSIGYYIIHKIIT